MKSMVQSLLKKHAVECDYLEIRIEESASTSIAFRGANLDTLWEAEELGGCVRALYKGSWGFVTFNDLDALAARVNDAIVQARLIGKGTSAMAPAPVVKDMVEPRLKRDPRAVPLSEKIEILRRYNQLILSADPRIPTSSVSYGDSFRKILFCNSDGSVIEQERRDLGCNLVAIAVDKGQTQMDMVGCGGSDDFDVLLGHEDELMAACQRAVYLLDAPPVKGGTYTVVANQAMAGTFVHEAFGHTSEGEKVYENERLQEIMKIGKAFGSSILSIYDTGLAEGSRGAIVYDEEGVRAGRTDLIKDGILVGRLHTRETAGKLGEPVTGSARAVSYKYPPIPRMRVTCIARGESSFADMIKDVKLGVYACDAMGGQGGEMFTFTAGRGYMIRDGRIEEMVKGVTLSGNLFVTLKNIDMVGNDFTIHEAGGGCGKGEQFPLPVAMGAPHIRIRDVVIGGQ
ncbi:TldD/PmbA family protein [bacterium]|nr:TldD/PmbA family protein [candidate division CSSED10-310 bacterium]